MVVAAHIAVGRHRAVGDYQVQALDRQPGQQVRELSFAADNAQGFRELERRFQQHVGDRLLHRIGHADGELQRPLSRPVAQRLFQFFAEREDFIRIAEHHAPRVVKFEPSADAVEEPVAERLFEQRKLAAHGLRSQMQLFAGAADAAAFGHHPEVMQVLVVE